MTTELTARPKPAAKKRRQLKPVCIGPTWERDPRGGYRLPKWTLGWQILGWTREYLFQPDGPNAGEPWVYTDEQARFLLHWYAVDRDGRFLYRYGMLRRMKGWGKDPFAATLCAIELVGPCRFSHWEGGMPVAVSHPAAWIQAAAVSREQTRNTMTLFPGLFGAPDSQTVSKFALDIGKEIIYAEHGRRRIEAVTSSPRALEGGRPTFTLKNETHHWLRNNDGHEMAKVIARNAAKSRDGSSRVLAISNAHAPGENSDAQQDWEAYQKIKQRQSSATGFLYDSLEAPAGIDLADEAAVREGLRIARGDSEWVDVERLAAEVRDPRTGAAMARRFYFNQLEADEDKPYNLQRVEKLKKVRKVPDGALIVLGFDGSRKRDHTALVATEVESGYQWLYGYWEPSQPAADGELWIPSSEVSETVDDAFERYSVWRMYADPAWWFSELAAWEGKYGEDKVVKFATNQYRRMASVLVDYQLAIETAELSHDGDPRFVGSFGNAHKREHGFRDEAGEPMWTIQKERPDSPLKIDAVMAGALSWRAYLDAIAEGATKDEPMGISVYVPEED